MRRHALTDEPVSRHTLHRLRRRLPISDWFALFDRVGFDGIGFHELRAPAPSPERRFLVSAEWAYDYSSEQVWNLRKRH